MKSPAKSERWKYWDQRGCFQQVTLLERTPAMINQKRISLDQFWTKLISIKETCVKKGHTEKISFNFCTNPVLLGGYWFYDNLFLLDLIPKHRIYVQREKKLLVGLKFLSNSSCQYGNKMLKKC